MSLSRFTTHVSLGRLSRPMMRIETNCELSQRRSLNAAPCALAFRTPLPVRPYIGVTTPIRQYSSSGGGGEQPETQEETKAIVEEFCRRAAEDSRLEYRYNSETDAHVFIVGVSHNNTFFYDLVRTVVYFVRPDTIVVELDPRRAAAMRQKFDTFLSYLEQAMLRRFSTWTFLLGTLFTLKQNQDAFQGWNEKGYGKEMWVAMHEAERLGARVRFGDQDQMVTLKRYTRELLHEFNTTDLRSQTTKDQIKANKKLAKLNNSDDEEASKQLRAVLREMPTKSKILGDERDLILINALKSAPGRKVVGVMGLAHLDGIVEYWDKEEERMQELGLSKEEIAQRMRRGRL